MYVEFEKGEKFVSDFINADKSENIDTFEDAGYILEDSDVIVDIDSLSKQQIKELIDVFGIKTKTVWTDRGCHLYFKRPLRFRKANYNCVLGFPIEYKHSKNTKAVTVKRNGVAREVDNEGLIADLPEIFNFYNNKSFENLVGLEDSDGRNNALYKHKMTLVGLFTDPEIREILKFINECLYSVPLAESEFNVVAREEIVPKSDINNEYEIANYLIKELDYCFYADDLFFRPRGEKRFINDQRALEKIVWDVCGNVKTHYVKEVLNQMESRATTIPEGDIFKISLKNGYLHDGKFVDIVIDEFTPYYLDYNYNSNVTPVPLVDEYLDHLTNSDPNYRNLLLEVLGHTLIVNPEFKRLLAKFFIFIGGGGNGKGTLLEIISKILGDNNCTYLSAKELTDERYKATLKGKLANLGDDLEKSALNDAIMQALKNISTCDNISSRRLFQQSQNAKFTCSLIFTSNHLLKSFEKGKSFKRRVMWLPMFTEVKESNRDPLFLTKITTPEAIEYWIKLIIEGYMRLYKNGKFTDCNIVTNYNDNYHKENNPYLLYLENHTAEDLVDQPIKEIYDDVENWCNNNAIEFSKSMFRDTVSELFKLNTSKSKRINGVVMKVFGREESK